MANIQTLQADKWHHLYFCHPDISTEQSVHISASLKKWRLWYFAENCLSMGLKPEGQAAGRTWEPPVKHYSFVLRLTACITFWACVSFRKNNHQPICSPGWFVGRSYVQTYNIKPFLLLLQQKIGNIAWSNICICWMRAYTYTTYMLNIYKIVVADLVYVGLSWMGLH